MSKEDHDRMEEAFKKAMKDNKSLELEDSEIYTIAKTMTAVVKELDRMQTHWE